MAVSRLAVQPQTAKYTTHLPAEPVEYGERRARQDRQKESSSSAADVKRNEVRQGM